MEIAWNDEEAPTPRQRTRRILLAVAIVPWVVIGVALMIHRPAAEPALDTTTTSPATPAPQEDEPAEETDVPSDLTKLPHAVETPTATEPASSSLEAMALMLASHELRNDPETNDAYNIQQLAVEVVDTTSPAITIVTVLASYRHETDLGMLRIAVPLAVDDTGLVTALPPYRLPDHNLVVTYPDLSGFTHADNPTPILPALAAAGYTDITVHNVFHSPDWPTLALITATHDTVPTDALVVLHDTPEGYTVAGASGHVDQLTTLSEALR